MYFKSLVPELSLFPTQDQQRRVWKKAASAMVFTPRVVLWAAVLLPIWIWARFYMSARFGWSSNWFLLAHAGIFTAVFFSGAQLICLRRMRLMIRKELRRMGIIVCLSCGYQLLASQKVCPECGTESSNQAPLEGGG